MELHALSWTFIYATLRAVAKRLKKGGGGVSIAFGDNIYLVSNFFLEIVSERGEGGRGALSALVTCNCLI